MPATRVRFVLSRPARLRGGYALTHFVVALSARSAAFAFIAGLRPLVFQRRNERALHLPSIAVTLIDECSKCFLDSTEL
jgi:hypothetical protein